MNFNNATKHNKNDVLNFLKSDIIIFRHLDWHDELDWLGDPGFLCKSSAGQIESCICCTPEVPESAWLRFFGAPAYAYKQLWQELLPAVLASLRARGIKRLTALGTQYWLENLLQNSGFKPCSSIVFLEWCNKQLPETQETQEISIRMMGSRDLTETLKIDQLSFPPLWQLSNNTFSKAYHQSTYSTVVLSGNKIVGFLISTASASTAHLSRLAVLPVMQRCHIGWALVTNMLQHYDGLGLWKVTVNTQSDNVPSLMLYRKLGFEDTGEEIKVYQLDF